MMVNSGVDRRRCFLLRNRYIRQPAHLGEVIAAKSGRPLDHALTATLLDTTLHLLAHDGLARVNADAVAAGAKAGRAAIYRRWTSIPALIADAVHTCELIPHVCDTGSLRTDLIAFLQPWTHRLTRCERAAAALLGHAGRDTMFDAVLQDRVVRPLAAAITQITSSHSHREPPPPPQQVRLLGIVVQSLWWQRYTSNSAPSTPAEVQVLVDQVLLPVAQPD